MPNIFSTLVFKCFFFSSSVPSLVSAAVFFFLAAGCRGGCLLHTEVVCTLTLLEGGRVRRQYLDFRGSIRSFLSAWPECVQSVEFKQDGLYQDFKSSQALCWQLNEAIEALCHVKPLIVQTSMITVQVHVKLTDSSSLSIHHQRAFFYFSC